MIEDISIFYGPKTYDPTKLPWEFYIHRAKPWRVVSACQFDKGCSAYYRGHDVHPRDGEYLCYDGTLFACDQAHLDAVYIRLEEALGSGACARPLTGKVDTHRDAMRPRTIEELRQLAERVRTAARTLDQAVLDAELAGLRVELGRNDDGWAMMGGPKQDTMAVSYRGLFVDITYPLAEEHD